MQTQKQAIEQYRAEQREFTLSAHSRGYKQPGKKLLPRDSYLAGMGGNTKSRVRDTAAECAHMGGDPQQEYSHAKRLRRELNSLSARARKLVETCAIAEIVPVGAHRRRAYNAMQNFDSVERCLEIDADMLANAY